MDECGRNNTKMVARVALGVITVSGPITSLEAGLEGRGSFSLACVPAARREATSTVCPAAPRPDDLPCCAW